MKNKYVKRLLSVMAATAMVVSMLSGCGSSGGDEGKKEAGKEAAVSDEDIEVWGTNTGYLPVEAGSELYNFYKEKIGVELYSHM